MGRPVKADLVRSAPGGALAPADFPVDPVKLVATWAAWVAPPNPRTAKARMADFRDLARRFDREDSPSGAFEMATRLIVHGKSQARLMLNEWVKRMALSNETIARRLSSARSWLSACNANEVIDWSLVFKGPKVQRYGKLDPTPWDKVEAAKETEHIRDRLIAELLGQGLRSMSILSIRCCDVNLVTRYLTYRIKGGGESTKEMPVTLLETMQAYESTFNPRKDGADSAYVRNWRGKPITHSGLTKICQKYGLGSTHRVRHGAAEEARKRKVDALDIKDFLDHQSVATTQIYLSSLSSRENTVGHLLAKKKK